MQQQAETWKTDEGGRKGQEEHRAEGEKMITRKNKRKQGKRACEAREQRLEDEDEEARGGGGEGTEKEKKMRHFFFLSFSVFFCFFFFVVVVVVVGSGRWTAEADVE